MLTETSSTQPSLEKSLQKSLNQSGRFTGRYQTKFSPYTGAEYAKIGFIFPGQGSPEPGMFKAQLNTLQSFQERFHHADLFVRKQDLAPLSDYILAPERIPTPQLAAVRSLCLYTAAVALFDHLQSLGIEPHVNIGYSYGEVAALAASGIMRFEDLLETLHHREAISPPAHSLGYMIVALASPQELTSTLKDFEIWIANLNSGRQTVLSCRVGDASAILKTLKKARLVARLLEQVPQPYHSPLMEDVASSLRRFQREKNYIVSPPQIPLVSWVMNKVVTKDNFKASDFENFFGDVNVKQVNFPLQVERAFAAGCGSFLELGPIPICKLFVKDVLAKSRPRVLEIEKYLGQNEKNVTRTIVSADSKLVALISQAVSTVTGYELDEIKVQDRFQEDLGIDSLKKAEIVFRVLQQSGIESQQVPNLELSGLGGVKTLAETAKFIEDALAQKTEGKSVGPADGERETVSTEQYQRFVPNWQAREVQSLLSPIEVQSLPRAVLIEAQIEDLFCSHHPVAEQMARLLANDGRTDTPHVALILRDSRSRNTASPEALHSDIKNFLLPLAHGLPAFAKALSEHSARDRLTVVLVKHPDSHPFVSGLGGFLKSLKKETDAFSVKVLEVSRSMATEELERIVQLELLDAANVEVRFREGRREVLRYRAEAATSGQLEDRQIVIAVGGAKGISLQLLKAIAQKKPTDLYLCGRSPENEPSVQKGLVELRALAEVRYFQIDAAQPGAISGLTQAALEKHGRIDVLMNSAGLELSKYLEEKTRDEIDQEILAKLLPTIETLLAAEAARPRQVIQFSSVSGEFGNIGQTIYAYTNKIVTELVRGFELSGVSKKIVHWGPWDGVGMTANLGVLMMLKTMGIDLLKPEVACRLFADEWLDSTSEEVTYLLPLDPARLRYELINTSTREMLLGERTSQSSASLTRLRRSMSSSKATYLRDHRFHTLCLLPAAEALSTFHHAALLAFGEVTSFHGFKVHNMLRIEEDERAVDLTFVVENECVKMALNTEMKHFSCTGSLERKALKSIDPNLVATEAIDMASVYSPTCIDFGPSFQLVHEAYRAANGQQWGVVFNSRLPVYTDHVEHDRFVQWTDAAFQSLSCVGILRQSELGVPNNVAAIHTNFDEEVTERLLIVPTVETLRAGHLKGDVTVYNSFGRPLLALEGVEMGTVRIFEKMPLIIKEIQ